MREELGSQLEKLKRQAATARRYKELKAKERKYKAELYALKWHKYNEQLNLYEKDRMEKEAQLEAFISEQRGGELGMLQLKEQQQDLSDAVQKAQQQVYQIGTQITRLEQQIVFAQEKQSNQQERRIQLQDTIAEAKEHLQLEGEKQQQLEGQLAEVEPEMEMLQAQLEQAHERLMDTEREYEDWQASWERQQRVASQSQQSEQVLKTKIQGQNNHLQRAQQRQRDLQSEITDIDDPELQKTLVQVQQQLVELTQTIERHQQQVEQAEWQLEQHKSAQLQAQQALQQVSKAAQTSQIKLENLESWLQSYQQASAQDLEQALAQQGIENLGALLTQLTVQEQWQQAIESLLSHHGHAIAVDALPSKAVNGALVSPSNVKPVNNSAASVITSGIYPAWLNHVALINEEKAREFETGAAQGFFSGIDKSGNWYGENWQSQGSANASGERDVLAKIQQIELLRRQVTEEQEALQQAQQSLERENALVEQEQSQLVQYQQSLTSSQQQQMELNMQVKLQQQQLQQNASLKQKLEQELELVAEQIELDRESIVMLEQELELGQEQNAELSEQLEQLEIDKAQLQQAVSNNKQQLERIKNASHQRALMQQTLKSQYQACCQTVTRAQQHLQQLDGQLAEIVDAERLNLDPSVELKMQLEEQLQSRLEAEQTLVEQQNQLADITDKITQLEQGQSGILAKLESMRSDIANVKLDSEGARVRAQSMLDTLNEMDQALKPILETMSVDANEADWSQELEQTSYSISRLGAINLAAIEEYDIQAERKGYLDTQFQDLVDALDTLESAIRKIDRESRAKFKDTYEKVNADLQMLFPKVFGGGSAYLELTGDDLLETGVTIMARPPGKKNSTIHLLSGGEKALTALSLVFSIFRLNPAPFCMLDEVDAPLDDANVGRFCNLVQEMSETVQFIYISHNKVAMEMATHLTGVTMQEPGVSRLVAVDIQQAVKMAEA